MVISFCDGLFEFQHSHSLRTKRSTDIDIAILIIGRKVYTFVILLHEALEIAGVPIVR